MSIKDNYFDLILKYANKYKQPKHNTKYSNKYYLTHILDVLGDVVTWKSLIKVRTISSNKTYHYKTINKIHLEWSRNEVYKKAYNKMLKINNLCKLSVNNFIDGTLIINKSGIENIGYGCGESRKKKFTAITCICNENTKPITIVNCTTYTKELNKVKTIRTLPHDSQTILPAIKSLKTNKSYNLVGDSGFLFDRSLIPANVNLITVKRKNQLVQNTVIENQILKKRYKIENLFARIKQFNRVHVRRDKLIVTYLGFVHLAFMKII
jgi:hypothetical protein